MAESNKKDSYIPLEDLPGHESERTLTPTNEFKISSQSRNMDEEAAVGSGGQDIKTEDATTEDPNAIGWDGPDDPNNPLNWPAWKKWSNIGALSLMTLLT